MMTQVTNKSDKIDQTAENVKKIVIKWLVMGKVGNITINTFKGGVSSINLNQTIKLGE
jgi:hypothetical protein